MWKNQRVVGEQLGNSCSRTRRFWPRVPGPDQSQSLPARELCECSLGKGLRCSAPGRKRGFRDADGHRTRGGADGHRTKVESGSNGRICHAGVRAPPTGVAGQFFGALFASQFYVVIFLLRIVPAVLLLANNLKVGDYRREIPRLRWPIRSSVVGFVLAVHRSQEVI